jgi:hyperosmotically inducible periplasmic protein
MLRRYSFVILALSPWLVAPLIMLAQRPDRALVEAVGRVYQLRSYTAFDWVSGAYDRGRLTLRGFVRSSQLREEAAAAARSAPGIDEVDNQLQVLPAHRGDDDIRIAAYIAIYGSSALERYAPSGQLSGLAISELRNTARFGLEGTDVGRGPHSIHIIVNSGRILLRGEVRTRGDRQIAEANVRTLPGVLSVVNELRVATPE